MEFIVIYTIGGFTFQTTRIVIFHIIDYHVNSVTYIGKTVGANLGDAQNPLLVSVRSGSRASMPGMMDTILTWA